MLMYKKKRKKHCKKTLSLFVVFIAVPVVEAKGGRGCKQASKLFPGPCKDHSECNKKCREAEKAKSGLCRSEGTKGKKCFCYMC